MSTRATTASTKPAAVRTDTSRTNDTNDHNWNKSKEIPSSFDAPFGSYPNFLKITSKERESFSPVVIFPEDIDIVVKDHRRSSGELASSEDIQEKRIQKTNNVGSAFMLTRRPPKTALKDYQAWLDCWGIGKYDENRDGGMYKSDLFDDLDNTIDGYGGRRTVHLGMDLGGPAGTPVYAFCDGIVHSVGYNPGLGDYGYVIVVEHFWGEGGDGNDRDHQKRCWALYGHLDETTLTRTKQGQTSNVKPGDSVRKGELLGRMGDISENGGWIKSHLHFQLSMKPPDQPHDMPGASSVADRVEALQQYIDPRYVLGPMY